MCFENKEKRRFILVFKLLPFSNLSLLFYWGEKERILRIIEELTSSIFFLFFHHKPIRFEDYTGTIMDIKHRMEIKFYMKIIVYIIVIDQA